MTDKVNESFSAFLDGEASELDIQRLLKAMDDQPERMRSWHQLTQVSAVMQQDVVVDTGARFLESDEQSARQDDAPLAAKREIFGLKIGVAAMAAFVVVGWLGLAGLPAQQGPEVATVSVQPTAQSAETSVGLAQQQFESQRRLNEYLRQHAEQASFTTGHAVVPAELEWVEEFIE